MLLAAEVILVVFTVVNTFHSQSRPMSDGNILWSGGPTSVCSPQTSLPLPIGELHSR